MNINIPVSAILAEKGSQVWSVSPDATVFDAISLMAEKNVGALPVLEGDRLAGIISERDYTRQVVLKGKASKTTRVREIMSSHVTLTGPHDTVESCMRLMTERKVRHLPVVEGQRLVGLISIGDVVKWVISAQAATIDQLRKYIDGSYPG